MSLLHFLHLLTLLTCCLAGGTKSSKYENGPSYRNQQPPRSSYGGPSFGPSYGYTSTGSRNLQLSCVPDQMLVGFYLCEAINPTAAQLQSYPTYGYAQNVYGQSLGNYGTIPKQFNYQPRYPNPYGMSSNYIQSEILPPGGGSPITINCNSPPGGANNQPGSYNNPEGGANDKPGSYDNPEGGANDKPGSYNNPEGGANNKPGCNCNQNPGMNSPKKPAGGNKGGANPVNPTDTRGRARDASQGPEKGPSESEGMEKGTGEGKEKGTSEGKEKGTSDDSPNSGRARHGKMKSEKPIN